MHYNVLILEDNEMDASLMEEHLMRSEYNYRIHWVETGEAYEQAVTDSNPDVIVSDYRLKQYSGLDALHYKNIHCEEIPMIIVSGTIGEEQAVELIKKGAADFLIKNSISNRLSQAVVRAIKESLEKEKRKKAELQLKNSEKRFRLLFEHSLDGIIIEHPGREGTVITANDAMCKMTGYTTLQLQDMPIKELVALNEEASPYNSEEFCQDGLFRGEMDLKRKDGSSLPVEVSSRTVELKSGEERSFHIVRDVSARREYERQLEARNAFTDKVINSLPGIFYVMNEDQQYLRVNRNVETELGYGRKEFQQMNPLDHYDQDDQQRVSEEINRALVEGQSSMVARMKKKNGNSGMYLITGSRFTQEEKKYVLGTAINITDRIEAQKRVEESLKEKETLLTEIHHRVKNNLAIVSGLVQLQAFNEADEECAIKLLSCVSRIQSIALIHEHLYKGSSLSHVEVSTNLQELLEKIQETLSYETEIEHSLNLQQITLNINQAIPFALLFNEIITNIYKHAFKGRASGKIEVDFKEKDDQLTMLIRDNGIGLPEGFDIEEADSTGLTLIHTLCKQLKGEITYNTTKGTEFQLQFQRSESTGSSNSLKKADESVPG